MADLGQATSSVCSSQKWGESPSKREGGRQQEADLGVKDNRPTVTGHENNELMHVS